jgi:thioredoxin-like negative regulator of GroEL
VIDANMHTPRQSQGLSGSNYGAEAMKQQKNSFSTNGANALGYFALWLSLVATSAKELCAQSTGQEDKGQTPVVIPMQHDYDEAVVIGEKLGRPILVVLGAEWCGPCKQLEKELELPNAAPIFQKWIVVKVDIDKEVGLSKEWKVNAVPAFRILGFEQEVAASNEGFAGLKKLQIWLDEHFESANPQTLSLLRSVNPVDSKAVLGLISLLRDKRPATRKMTSELLAKNKSQSAGPLVGALSTGNLSQKIGSLEILEKWSAPIAGIDPWEPDTISAEKLAELGVWLQANTNN